MGRTKENARKSHRPTKRKSTDYDSDDGFIEQDSDNAAPPNKRAKPAMASSLLETQTDSNGDKYWEIAKMRRVTISEFKGKKMVGIREYYEQGGKVLPGKKGISLPMNQYSALIELLPYIEKELTKTGETIPRPQYDGVIGEEDDKEKEEEGDVENEVEADEEDDEHTAPRKSNIEATSDEEEDD